MNISAAKSKVTAVCLSRPAPYIVMLILFGSVIGYVAVIVPDVVSRDQWRFIPLISNFYNGTLSFSDFWVSHSAHVKPGYKVLWILNAVVFGLNTKLATYAGLLLLLATAWLIYRRYESTMPQQHSPLLIRAGFVTIAAVLFSFNQLFSFIYSLLALGGYAGTLLNVSAWLLADAAIRRSRYGLTLAGCCAVLWLDILGFAGARSPSVVVAMLVGLSVFAILSDRERRSKRFVVTFVLFAASVIGEAVYWSLLNERGPGFGPGGSLQAVLHQPLATLHYFATGAAASTVPAAAIVAHTGVSYAQVAWVGYVVIVLGAYTIYRFFRFRMWQMTSVPLMLMLYSAGFLCESFLARFSHFGVGNAAAPRYILDLMPAAVGIIWILVWTTNYTAAGTQRDIVRRTAVPGLLAIIFFVQAGTGAIRYYTATLQYNTGVAAIHQVVSGSFKKNWVCPSVRICTRGRDVLLRHHLNVFRPGYVIPQPIQPH